MANQDARSQSPDPMPLASRKFRAAIYAFAWLPPLGFTLLFTPQFRPIFGKLEERGGLPEITQWVWAFVYLNEAWFYAPAVLVFIILLLMAEFAIAVSPRKVRNNGLFLTAWLVDVICIGFVGWLAPVIAFLIAVFRISEDT